MGRNLETALERLRRTLEDVPAEVMERRLREAEALEAGRCETAPRRKRKKMERARDPHPLASLEGGTVEFAKGGAKHPQAALEGGTRVRRRRDGDGVERERAWVPEEDWRRGYWDDERLEAAGFR